MHCMKKRSNIIVSFIIIRTEFRKALKILASLLASNTSIGTFADVNNSKNALMSSAFFYFKIYLIGL